MKILLIYFTGTYNTRYLTNYIEKLLGEKGHQVEKAEINCDLKPINTKDYDYIGFGYPIYGFNSPRPFNQYVKKLSYKEGQKYFIYKNSGETYGINNASDKDLLRLMKKRKCVLSGQYHFVMPYNIHFPFEKDFVREILAYDDKLAKIMIYDLENGYINRINSNFIYNVAASAVAIQRIGGDINSFLYKVDSDKCVKCMKCIENCPEKNIVVKGDKIKFNHHCDMCMRCSFFCPTNAINIGLLQNWRVNGDYYLEKMQQDGAPVEPYITNESKGFYKCFIKTFKDIDVEYNKRFGSR